MTVITKPISDNKPAAEKPLVVCINEKLGVECVEAGSCRGVVGAVSSAPGFRTSSSSPNSAPGWVVRKRNVDTRRNFTVTTSVVAAVALMLIFVVGVTLMIFYRSYTHSQASRLRVFCGVPFQKNTLRFQRTHSFSEEYTPRDQSRIALRRSFNWPSSLNNKANSPYGINSDGMFNEQLDLDLESDSYQEIYVPDFGINRVGFFIHDHKANLTVIVDISTSRCFVLALDRSLVDTPRNILQFVNNMNRGLFKGNMIVIRETMRVVRPPVLNVVSLGPDISNKCSAFVTYRLIHGTVRNKRESESMGGAGGEYKQLDNEFTVVEFAGKNIIEYTIIDE